eukprot:3060799-Pyramimonas_sp.AAC.1
MQECKCVYQRKGIIHANFTREGRRNVNVPLSRTSRTPGRRQRGAQLRRRNPLKVTKVEHWDAAVD